MTELPPDDSGGAGGDVLREGAPTKVVRDDTSSAPSPAPSLDAGQPSPPGAAELKAGDDAPSRPSYAADAEVGVGADKHKDDGGYEGEVAPTRSGESLFRSLRARSGDPVLRQLPSTFLDLLAEGGQADNVPWKLDEARKELATLAALVAKCREQRCQTLEEHIRAMDRFVGYQLQRMRHLFTRYEQHIDHVTHSLDKVIVALVLHYHATLEKEFAIHQRRVQQEERMCRRLEEHSRASFDLNMFALHLEAESAGQVLLRRLPSNHPQFLRCRRAALENVKSGFFNAKGRYTGITVLDVLKIENQIMLRRFQKAAAAGEPGKVKGLFCVLPKKALERVVVFGMGDAPPMPAERAAIFRGTWMSAVANMAAAGDAVLDSMPETLRTTEWDKQRDLAAQRVDAAETVSFPRTFSRYSTLEDDREIVAATGDSATLPTAAASGGAGGKDAEEPSGESKESRDDAHESSIRYLALCRVVVGKVFVAPKDADSFPPAPEGGYNAIYNPKLEEYLILNPRDVLPEFLVQYKYVNDSRVGAVASDASGRNPPVSKAPPPSDDQPSAPPGREWIVATDLSVPTVEGGAGVERTARAMAAAATSDGGGLPRSELASVSASPVVFDGTSAGKSASSRKFDWTKTYAREDATPWAELRANAHAQRSDALRTLKRAFSRVWVRLRNNCGRDTSLPRHLRPSGGNSRQRRGGRSSDDPPSAAASALAALQEAVAQAEEELQEQRQRRHEVEREVAAAAASGDGPSRRRRDDRRRR